METQRSKFYKLAEQGLADALEASGPTGRTKNEATAAVFLEESSREGNALIGFQGIQGRRPRVYVWGHGKPGVTALTSRLNRPYEKARAKDVADVLKKVGLAPDSDVRVLSCYGAAEEYIDDSPIWLESFHEGTLADRFDPGNSFISAFNKHLLKKGLKNVSTSGYYLATTWQAGNVTLRGGGDGVHMAALAYSKSNEIEQVVRRRDVRVTIRN